MPSGTPWTPTHDFANDPDPPNKVNAAALQAQFDELAGTLALLYTALGVSIRDDDTLTDELVRIRNLHPELMEYFNSRFLTSFLDPVRAASTAHLTLATAQTIDGVAVVAGDRVLVKDQATSSFNGIYEVAAGAWTRVTDLPAGAWTDGPFAVTVEEGTVNGGKTFGCVSAAVDGFEIGTGDLDFFDMFPAGVAGATGADGADGNTILYGTAAPTTEGADGDFYIRTTTNFIYGPKAGGVWPAGTSLVGPAGATGSTGAAGADGNTILSGASPPTGGIGVDGDFYLNTATSTLYGPKAAGAWPAGVSLIGATGPTGPSVDSEWAPKQLTGSGNWTVPGTGSQVWRVSMRGGGGSGATPADGGNVCGAGGAGYRIETTIALTGGAVVAYSVGAGGAARAAYGGTGNAGSATTFGGLSAAGGKAGIDGGNIVQPTWADYVQASGQGDPPGSYEFGVGSRGGSNPNVDAAGAAGSGQGGGIGSYAQASKAGGSGHLFIQRMS